MSVECFTYKNTFAVLQWLFFGTLIRHEIDIALIALVILRRMKTKSGLMYELFGCTVAERYPHVQLALVKLHDARESLAAEHQQVGSTYF